LASFAGDNASFDYPVTERSDKSPSDCALPGRSAMTEILEGVAQARNPGRAVIGALARQGRVAYSVSIAPLGASKGDKRTSQRRRSRLRSAKLLDANNRFLCECLVNDYSGTGLRLTLLKNIGLPSRCALFDDTTGEVRAVATVWRRDLIVGMRYRLNERPAPLSRSALTALRGRYYAVAD
jgi:hypothetical protein